MIKYIVKARLAKNIGTDDFTFESFDREFRNDENPIQARKKAFQFYFSLTEQIGKGENDFEIIQKNIDRGIEVISESPDKYSEFDYNFVHEEVSINIPGGELGIGIYFIIDDGIEYPYVREESGCMILGNKGTFDYLQIIHNLEGEYNFYIQNKLDTENWTKTIKYWDFSDIPEDPVFQEVLWTPFDFWNHWNPAMKRVQDILRKKNEATEPKETDEPKVNNIFSDIIQEGENHNVEFKSSLQYCYFQKKAHDSIKIAVTKTIVAFANSAGGLLLIGVADNKELLGLENDFSTFDNNPKDGFLLQFDNLLRTHFSEPIDAIIKFGFEQVNSKTIFRVEVEKSNKPRFLINKLKGKEFYIRRSGSTVSLDVEDAVKYIIDKWYVGD